MILSHLDSQGGFTVGDTDTGATAYAFPTSTHATNAKRQPETVAAKMGKRANDWGTHMTRANEAYFHRHNWTVLLAIR